MPTPYIDEALFGQAETSSTTQSVTTGVKTFTLDVDNGYAQTDYTVQIISTADPDCWMYGVVTSKSSPSITVNVFKVSPTTGTFTDWTIQVIAGPFAGLPASQTLGFSSNVTASHPAIGDVLNWTIETGKAFYDNSTVYVSAVNDRTDFFFATVVSYNSGTGALKLVVNRTSGSGGNSLWAISLIDVTQSFRTAVGNTAYTIKPSDNVVVLTTALTASRIWTLPLAASVPSGYTIRVVDEAGSVSGTASINVDASGSDQINQAGIGLFTLSAPFTQVDFVSDGVGNWSADPIHEGVFSFTEALFEADVTINADLDVGDALTVGGTATFNGNILGANFRDSTTTFYNNADTTKKLAFQCSGIATATTRLATWPDANITVAGVNLAQTWTGTQTFGGQLRTTYATSPMGYHTGAGATVTQTTSKATAVTINAPCGRITTDNAALAGGASVNFTVNNSAYDISDVVILNSLNASYDVSFADSAGSGSFIIRLTNRTAGSLSQPVAINFAIISGVLS